MATKTRHALQAVARHLDGTDCTHRLSPRGKAVEDGCTGRHDYRASCTCGQWQETGPVKAALEYAHSTHREHPATGNPR